MSQVAISAPAHPPILDDEYARRFGGVARLYGPNALERFAAAHVCVIGIGGVGSWVAEALARCGIGKLTLIDLDHIAVSNTNRQIHALGDAYGMAKVDAMAERILQINPRAEISRIDDFVTVENVEALLGHPFDYVIDAIDAVKVKTAILAFCKRTGKRCVFVDNPSASSLARGLEQISSKSADATSADGAGVTGNGEGALVSIVAI